MSKWVWISFTLSCLLCRGNPFYFPSYNSTSYNSAVTAVGLSRFMKSVPNLLGFGVQFEDLLKDSFSESSNFNNFFLGADSRSSTFICIILFIAQNLGIVTHLQIWKLLAEIPPPGGCRTRSQASWHKCRCPSCQGRAPSFRSQLCGLCVTAPSLRTKWVHVY